jgi:hypothetical protein
MGRGERMYVGDRSLHREYLGECRREIGLYGASTPGRCPHALEVESGPRDTAPVIFSGGRSVYIYYGPATRAVHFFCNINTVSMRAYRQLCVPPPPSPPVV